MLSNAFRHAPQNAAVPAGQGEIPQPTRLKIKAGE